MHLTDHAIEQATITGSAYLTKGAGATAVVSGSAQYVAENPDLITLADWGVIVGIAGVICGLAINAVAHVRRDRRETRLYREKIQSLRKNP